MMSRAVEDIIKKIEIVKDGKYEVTFDNKKDANLVKTEAMLNDAIKNVRLRDDVLSFEEEKSGNLHAAQFKKVFCAAFKLSTAKFNNNKFLELAGK